MGIEEIKKRINEDADKEIAAINLSAKEKIENLTSSIERIADERASKILNAGKDEISLMKKQIIADAKIKAKDEIEKEKSFWIENVFEVAKTKILNLPDDEKAKMLKSLSNADETDENFNIYVDKKYSHLIKDKPHKTTDMDFGIIMESKDGRIRIDNTLTNKIKTVRQQIVPEIAKILFK